VFFFQEMYRRSLLVLVNRTERTIVRDPRIKKTRNSVASTPDAKNALTHHSEATSNQQPSIIGSHPLQPTTPPPLPFAPSEQNQQSLGSMFGSYMLAGFGMGLGVVLVRVILGA
jgi:hypothetical protein